MKVWKAVEGVDENGNYKQYKVLVEDTHLAAFTRVYRHVCNVEKDKTFMEDLKLVQGALIKYDMILDALPFELSSIEEIKGFANWYFNNDYEQIKAMKIIKEKEIDAHAIIHSTSLEDYKRRFWTPDDLDYPTQEEYELLKRVLL